MRALLQRLSGLDDLAESAVRVIELFDKLAQDRLSLGDLVRSAAMFSECTVGVTDATGHVIVRTTHDGHSLEPHKPETAVAHPVDGDGEVWLERAGPPLALDALVLERFAAAVALTRKREQVGSLRAGDPALIELMIRRAADETDRARAIRLLGLVAHSPIRVLAVAGPPEEVLSRCLHPLGKAIVQDLLAVMVHGDEDLHTQLAGETASTRVGVGPCVPASDAWRSWRGARLATRFADDASASAGGATAADPGLVFWDDLGGFATLAEYVPADAISEIPDVAALDQLAAERTGAMTLAALRAVCEAESVRVAARTLHMHHSSVAQRLDHAEQVLGFPVRTAPGRSRLSLALTLRRLRESKN